MSAKVVEVRKAEVTGPAEGSTTPRPPRTDLVDLGSLPVLILLALLFWNHTCGKWQALLCLCNFNHTVAGLLGTDTVQQFCSYITA